MKVQCRHPLHTPRRPTLMMMNHEIADKQRGLVMDWNVDISRLRSSILRWHSSFIVIYQIVRK